MSRNVGIAASVYLMTVSLASAQYYGYPGTGYGGPGTGGSSSGNGDSSGSSTDFGGVSRGGFGFGPDFDVTTATRYRTIHGILACLAFAVLFPIGAILLRLVPGRFAIWIHAATQVLAYIVFIAGAALGFWMIQKVQLPFAGGSLLNIAAINYHPIIGMVVLFALLFQPLLGIMHHSRFKELRRRQIWSHLHLWNGRIMIPLGIVNGGLGLKIAGASSTVKIVYAVVAGLIGAAWLLVAVFTEGRRFLTGRRTASSTGGGTGAGEAKIADESDGSRDRVR